MEVQTCAGLSCTLVLKNPTLVLELQVGAVHRDELYYKQGFQVLRSHSMNADIGVPAYKEVEKHI